MRLLVDTHLLLWWLSGNTRLPRRAREALSDAQNEVFFSAASVWEIAIKSGLRKVEVDPAEMLEALGSGGFVELPVTGRHAAAVMRLPVHHRDPFDRLLVAQSLVEPMHLLTDDRALALYGPQIILAG